MSMMNKVEIVLIANSEYKCAYDSSCVLRPGDHPFIRPPSYLYYKEAVIYKVDLLQQRIEDGEVFSCRCF